ncbi:MAG: hypothetical protein VX794_02965 [Nitrospinota bacterium]|nr:hypothetical protein [Nitrospinota bacterium]
MTFNIQENKISMLASLDEMKLVYRVLHKHITENLELMDSTFLENLQSSLQEKAQEEGIDIGHHMAWDQWLGNESPISCEERVKKRKQF